MYWRILHIRKPYRNSAASWSVSSLLVKTFVSDLNGFLLRTVWHIGSNDVEMTCCSAFGAPLPFLHSKKLGPVWWFRHGLTATKVHVDHFDVTRMWSVFTAPGSFLLWLYLPLGLYLALRIELWVLTACWLLSYCDAAPYWLDDVQCHPPPAVPQDWRALVASAGSM